MSSRFPLVFGAGSFGTPGPGSNGARIHTAEEAQTLVNHYIERDYNIIDTARIYGGGTSEEFLGRMELGNCVIDTKVYPSNDEGLSEKGIRESLTKSQEMLGKHRIRTLYLHAPDPTVSIEVTLRAVNDLYTQGCFKQFGLSNYSAWRVAEIVGITTQNGWVKPTDYQGGYNALERTVEVELLPCLRHFDIRFYAYSPLAFVSSVFVILGCCVIVAQSGGLLAGKMLSEEDMAARVGGRWDPAVSHFAPSLRSKYAPMFSAVRDLKQELDKHGLAIPEAAYRWLQHHSALKIGDSVIVGAASAKQLKMNISYSEGGPLSEDVVALFEKTWLGVKALAPHYAM